MFKSIILFTTYVVYVLFLKLILENKELNKNQFSCISLIVPSTENDFLKCYRQFLYNNITFQIASEVIFSISSVTNSTLVNMIISRIKIRNRIIAGLRKEKHNAASNRNYGFKLSHCSIISFFDMDDIMSQQRLSLIYSIFDKDSTVEFILHKYESYPNNINTIIPLPLSNSYRYNITYYYIFTKYREINDSDLLRSQWCCKNIEEIKSEKIHNGWPSMRRYIMKKIKYNSRYDYGEDSDFNSRVIISRYNVAILNITLGYYKKDNACNRNWI